MTVAVASFSVQATNYSGNGDSSWGGAVGQGSLTVSDSGANITFTLNRGPGTLDNPFVIYLDSVSGGFADTTFFSDDGDGARSAISGYTSTGNNGGSGRSILVFDSGFSPDYAISIENGYASLFQLVSGGANSLIWTTGTALSGMNNDPTYSLTVGLSQFGITPGSGQSFGLFGIMVSGTGYSSPEAIGGTMSGTSGWGNTQTQLTYSTYITAVPEPSSMALFALSGLATLVAIRRRR